MNWLLGTNFGFLARKPKTATLLDHLGDWPIYLLWLQLSHYSYDLSIFTVPTINKYLALEQNRSKSQS